MTFQWVSTDICYPVSQERLHKEQQQRLEFILIGNEPFDNMSMNLTSLFP